MSQDLYDSLQKLLTRSVTVSLDALLEKSLDWELCWQSTDPHLLAAIGSTVLVADRIEELATVGAAREMPRAKRPILATL
jgi:hypothetical protein